MPKGIHHEHRQKNRYQFPCCGLQLLIAGEFYFFSPLFSLKLKTFLSTQGPYTKAGPLPQEQSPSIILLIIGVVESWVTSVMIAISGLIFLAIISAPRK